PIQPPGQEREKKIRIWDPNQGGKDITEEIMSGDDYGFSELKFKKKSRPRSYSYNCTKDVEETKRSDLNH
uniref:Uncharacterized protein n=1 Tax=Rhinolophus ferrumequinum TaxID=59479 RepID=A0A671DWY4_RHIFE